jgi:hypothetical protein
MLKSLMHLFNILKRTYLNSFALLFEGSFHYYLWKSIKISLIHTLVLRFQDVVILFLLKTDIFHPFQSEELGFQSFFNEEVILALNNSFSRSHTKLYIYYNLSHYLFAMNKCKIFSNTCGKIINFLYWYV